MGRKSTKPKPAKQSGQSQHYVVLARRHRPAQFDQVIGQQHVTQTLRNAIEAERVHHAYLFTGSRGVGKTTVARILAKALNCDRGPTPTPCDECEPCRESGASVDLFEIDGASHTGVDDIRELRDNIRYLPARSRHKIYIIDEVHMLSTSAFNALLKTLEEPPPHVVFIFATTEPHKIPATILSRCQRFDFKRVQLPDLVAHLTRIVELEGVEVDSAGLSLIARAAEGSVRDSLSLLDQVIAYASGQKGEITAERVAEVLGVPDRGVLFALSGAVLSRDASSALRIIDELFVQGQDLSQFAQAFLSHLRDLVVVRCCEQPEALVDATEAEVVELRQQSSQENAELLEQHFDRFARAAEEIARSSHPRLLLEMALIEMINAEALLPLGDLLERLEQLEGRIGSAPSSGPGAGGGGGQGSARRPPPRRPSAPAKKTAPQRQQTAPPAASKSASLSRGGQRAEQRGEQDEAPADTNEPLPPQGSVHQRWQTLLSRVEQQQPVLASTYVTARLLSWSGDNEIKLGYPPGSFDLARAESRDKRQQLEDFCQRLLSSPVRIKVRAMRPEEEQSPELLEMSLADQRAREKVERAAKQRQEAETHPLTQAIVSRFGAKIQKITVNNDE